MVPESHRDLLDRRIVWHVATVDSNGLPQCNPVWIGWDGSAVRFSLTRDRQKFHNLVRYPHVALSATDPDNWQRYLEIRGVVTSIEPDEDSRLLDELARKYLGFEKYPFHQPGDDRVVVSVSPERFSKGEAPLLRF